MDNDQSIDIRLWDYIDGSSTETGTIEKLIKEKAAWRKKYKELLDIHTALQATGPEQPSLRFTKNVMEEITKVYIAPATKSYINQKIIWSITLFFITPIIGFIVYSISQINRTSSSNEIAIGIDFINIDYTQLFNSTFVNFFMMANVVLGLLLLDRWLWSLTKKRQKEIL